MKKAFVSFCMAATLAGLASCGSGKNAATQTSLAGEWNIIEVEGQTVVPAPGEEFPFIGFKTEEGQVYGYSGCNRMMGAFSADAQTGTIDLGPMASTRMMCPDMTLEDNILKALGKVKKYKAEEGQILLCGPSSHPLLVLQKRETTE